MIFFHKNQNSLPVLSGKIVLILQVCKKSRQGIRLSSGNNNEFQMKVFLYIGLFFIVFYGCKQTPEQEKPFVYFRNFSGTFNDLNDKHIQAALKYGISPIGSEKEVGRANRKLKKIASCKKYQVDPLTHSIPYLVPEAYDLLETISDNFKDSLKCKGLPSYQLIVTSVLRTDETVKKLKKNNVNASSNSAHLYGTTFDIAHARYKQNGSKETTIDKLKTVLAEVLQDLRKQKKCYVRYEYKQICFHITVR